MVRFLTFLSLGLFVSLSAFFAYADHPSPNVYPTSWELKFEHGLPKRIAVDIPGEKLPKVFWYLPYTVTNTTGRERSYFPGFTLLTRDGRLIRADENVPLAVCESIRKKEGNKLLEFVTDLAGVVRLGPDQARDGAAVWPEPMVEMGSFSIFVAGLNEEESIVKRDVTVRLNQATVVKVDDKTASTSDLKIGMAVMALCPKNKPATEVKAYTPPTPLPPPPVQPNVNGRIIDVEDESITIQASYHLRKTLQLNYLIRGDDVYPGEDEVNENAEVWVMW